MIGASLVNATEYKEWPDWDAEDIRDEDPQNLCKHGS